MFKIGIGLVRTVSGEEDGNNESVNADHARHDHRDDRLHDNIRAINTNGGDSNTGLGGAVSGSNAWGMGECVVGGPTPSPSRMSPSKERLLRTCKNKCRGDAHEAEEGGGGFSGVIRTDLSKDRKKGGGHLDSKRA